jgi:hypothetical protein
MRYLDVNLRLKISKDCSVELSLFGRKVAFDAGLNHSETQVKWLIGKLGLLNDCFVAGCLDICWMVLETI